MPSNWGKLDSMKFRARITIMSPTIYQKPDGPNEGDLVIRMWVKSASGIRAEVDRLLEPDELELFTKEAELAGEMNAISRASRGERVSWQRHGDPTPGVE